MPRKEDVLGIQKTLERVRETECVCEREKERERDNEEKHAVTTVA